MEIDGLQGMSMQDLSFELDHGGRFVIFTYCVSILILTFRRPSKVFFLRGGESAFLRGLPYLLITLLFGWWGIPWGPIYSLGAIANTLSGGKDVTQELVPSLRFGKTF